jgi:hypothetical protein
MSGFQIPFLGGAAGSDDEEVVWKMKAPVSKPKRRILSESRGS